MGSAQRGIVAFLVAVLACACEGLDRGHAELTSSDCHPLGKHHVKTWLSVLRGQQHSTGGEQTAQRLTNELLWCRCCLAQVYQKLLDAGLQPISTTYTALISAFGKAGQLDKALETFQTMIQQGCERSVITYSALISACEKAGRWELALDLFDQMQHEGCNPNTVTYNSLITACQQGKLGETGAATTSSDDVAPAVASLVGLAARQVVA
jgi:pentatricopeptide repeat protein